MEFNDIKVESDQFDINAFLGVKLRGEFTALYVEICGDMKSNIFYERIWTAIGPSLRTLLWW